MSNAALAFLTGLGQGYLQGKDNLEKKARQKKLEEREDEDYEHRRKERQRQDEERRALAEAGKTLAVETGAGGMVRPETMDNRDVGLPENQQLPNQGLLPAAYRIGAQTFTDGNAAQTAADAANSPGGRVKRVAAALYGLGKHGDAMQVEATGRQAELADLQLKTTKDQLSRENVFREVTGQLARGGWSAVPKIYERYEDGRTAEVVEDGKGGATVLAKDKDGKEVGRKVFASMDDFILSTLPNMDPKLWVSESRLARQHAETARHNQATEVAAARSAGIAAGHLQLARDKQSADLKNDPFHNLPGSVKLQAQSLARQIETINSAITKARAEGTWNDQSGAALLEDARTLEIQYRQLLGPYTKAGGGSAAPAADPLGFNSTKAAAPGKGVAPAPRTAPAAIQPRPAAAAGMGVTAAPAPEEAAGQRLDAARAKLRQLRATAPGLAKGRAAIDQHAQAVAAARAELAAAEAEYQRQVAPKASRPAFIAASRGGL
jgi:hypothetical protein